MTITEVKISLETQVIMMFSWSRQMKGCFAEADTGERRSCWRRHMRGWAMFKKSIFAPTDSRRKLSCWSALLCFVSLCWQVHVLVHLALWLHREELAKDLLVMFLWLLAASTDSWWSLMIYLLDQAATADSCVVSAEWTGPKLLIHGWWFASRPNCWYLDSEAWNHPEELFLNRSTSPVS